MDPLRTGVVEGGVKLSEAGRECLTSRGPVRDRLPTFMLIGRNASEMSPEVAFGPPGLLQALFVVGDPALGGVDGVVVVASPATPARFIESRPGHRQRPLGVVSGSEDVGEMGAGVLPFAGPIGGHGGVELLDARGGGGAGVAELVDPKGERIIGTDAGPHSLGPVVIKPVANPDQVFSSPPFGLLETLEGDLVALECLDPGGDVVTGLPGGSRLPAVGGEPVFEVAALFSAPPAQPGQCTEVVELPACTDREGLHGFKPGLRRAQLLERRG